MTTKEVQLSQIERNSNINFQVVKIKEKNSISLHRYFQTLPSFYVMSAKR